MKNYQKYVLGAIFAFLFVLITAINPVYALETNEVQPAELIKYQEPVTVNSSLMSTLPSYFLQGVHIGTVGGDGGVLFANGTILNVSRTKKDNKPVPLTIGDDLRVDGEIWRGNMRGIADNMPLKVSDYMVPTLDDTYDLGEPIRRWQNLFLSGNLQGNDAKFSGDVEIEGNLIVNGSSGSTTKYLQIDGSTCIGDDAIDHSFGYCRGENSGVFKASFVVNLPSNSVVNQLDGLVADQAATVDFSCNLRKRNFEDASDFTDIASFSTSGENSQWQNISSSEFSEIVDSENFSYYIFCLSSSNAQGFSIGSLRLQYQ